MQKAKFILLNILPVLLMIALIPLIKDDYALAVAYIVIIVAAFRIKRESKDFLVFSVGLVLLAISESIFISTGVETFNRVTLFGLMPIWLPILWGYAFVAIKRVVLII